jgi:hypothetical protein
MDDFHSRVLAGEEEDALLHWERLRQQSQPPERLEQRSAPGEIVYKTYHGSQPQPQQTTQMDQRTADDWNRWLTTYVARALKDYNNRLVENLTEEIGAAFGDERKYMHGQIDKLREEIGALRADMTLDHAVVRGEVSRLRGNALTKRRKDVA